MCPESQSYKTSRFTATKFSKQTVDSSVTTDNIYVESHYALMQFQTATAYVVTAVRIVVRLMVFEQVSVTRLMACKMGENENCYTLLGNGNSQF
jgi:hypothetical protein